MTPEAKPLPGDLNVEQALIGCLLNDPDTQVAEALRIVSAKDFYFPGTGLIFDTIVRRHEKGDSVDLVTLVSHYYETGVIPNQFSPAFVSECYTACSNPSFTKHYAAQVLEASKKRQIIRIAAELGAAASQGNAEDDWRDLCLNALRKADSALMDSEGNDLIHIKEVGGQYADACEKDVMEGIDPAIPTGIRKLDELLEGGVRREYILIGGKQGHGKSLLAMQMAGELAKTDRRGLVIGYDMSALQVFMRDLAREARIPLSQVMGRTKIEGQGVFQALTRGIGKLSEWDVYYTTSPYVTFETAAAHARSLHRQKRLDFIVLDYLQRVPMARGKERADEALVSLSNKVDKLQKELGCTLIAPVQLNDDGLIREARGILDAPQLFIRIEMDEKENSDGVMEAGDDGWFRLIKNRFGNTNKRIPVFRNGVYQTFEDREYTPAPKETKRNNRYRP